MPQRPAVTQLPDPVRLELEKRLVSGGFAGYEPLSAWLSEQGYELSKSSIHRYGQTLERRLSAIKASTQAAQLIADAAPDEEDARSAAVISLVQTDLFEALLALQEADGAEPQERVKLLSQAARSIADVSRSSITNKRWAMETRERLKGKLDALDAAAKRPASGLDPDTLRRVREEIYGIL